MTPSTNADGPSNYVSATKNAGEFTQRTPHEHAQDRRLFELLRTLLPDFGNGWNTHQLVCLKRQSLSRLIYYYELYQKIVDVPGVICEFGVQWGATLAILVNLRGMLEPYNYSRVINGFDTFCGFTTIDHKDGGFSAAGDYATPEGYEAVLAQILDIQESFSPLSHITKFALIKGDASVTFPQWLADHPHAIVAMAIFDMDVYRPTRDVLELVVPRLTKGSLLVFDELNCPQFPGETLALIEVLGLNNLRLRRFRHKAFSAWAVFGD